jgi:hypothetical protein
MRWRMLGLLVVVTLGLGCPETYGIGGSIDDAMHRDMKAQAEEAAQCPAQAEVDRLCANPDDEQCPRRCM